MTAKEYLSRAFDIERGIRVRREQLQYLKDLTERITTATDGVRVDGTAPQSRIAVTVEKIVDLEQLIRRDAERMVRVYGEIQAVIDRIENPTYRVLLTWRYLCFKTWEQVSDEMHYSWQWVHKLHSRALKAAQEAIESDTISGV